ncbi:MAG: OmpA family protein [Bacteroidetes bacterium]|nr:OmpA family protein [Bacteroidota bacterium]
MKNIFFILSLLLSFSVSAQNVDFSKDNFPDNKDGLKAAQKELREGEKYYELGTFVYAQALEHFLVAQQFNPNNALLNFRIGNCYLYGANKLKALPYLEKAYDLNPSVDEAIHYSLARAYHLSMNFEKAITHYNIYQSSLVGNDAAAKLAETTKKIQECKTGIELIKKPARVFIDNIGAEINSPMADYGPVISADESVLMYTSRRAQTTGGQIDPNNNQYFEDIFVSFKRGGKWNPAVNLGPPINTLGHDATMGLSPDGQHLYIYIDDKGDGNVYECTLSGTTWSAPEKMNKNINTKSHETSTSLSYDGKTLYFVSNRPGGFGDRDIYFSKMDATGNWGPAMNIGSAINTPYGEEAVFAHPDGKTIYFSSQGHKTMGGYDIFKSVYQNGKWSEPENIGYPINTTDDDVFFVMAANGKRGYYSSFNPNGYGEKDIYVINFLGPEKQPILSTEDRLIASKTESVKEVVMASAVEVAQAQLTLLKGIITDAGTLQPLKATIDLIDNQKNEVIASFNSNSATGKYLVSLPAGKNYGIAVKAEGYLFHSENFDIPATAAFIEVEKNIALQKIEVGSKIVLNNIFFDFDKSTLRPESGNELERLIKLLNDIPSLQIEISGHTDNKGSAGYNQNLSESRAKAVVDYLLNKGIAPSRLTYKGYGFTQPIATNDTEEGRQMNRRTEFKILKK